MRSATLLRLFATLLCLSAALSAHAGKRDDDAIRRQAESSLLVSGQITISADGKVLDHSLDKVDALPKGIVDLTAKLASTWSFEPVVLSSAQATRSRMSLLYVVKPLDNDRHTLELRSASFAADLPPEAMLSIARRGRMPAYPQVLVENRIGGTVYLHVQVGRDGKVMNIDASHVNLRAIGSEKNMAIWRDVFSKFSIQAVRGWTFKPPTTGPDVDAPHWTGTLPVMFIPEGVPDPQPGKWEAYIPGPRKIIPWLDGTGLTAEQTDALAPNQFHSPGNSRRLTSPLMGG
jgi:hypothetical protein